MYGLTGIMGSGKTTAVEIFQKLGAHTINADTMAKQVLHPNYEQYNCVIQQLYKKLSVRISRDELNNIFSITSQGKKINRRQLGQLVFSKKPLLKILEKVIHPEIKKKFKEELMNKKLNQISIYDIPLLFEKKLNKKFKAIILVYTSEKIAIERAQLRTGLSINEIKERIKAQFSIENKKQMADYVIDNTGSRDDLVHKVKALWKIILGK